MSNKPSVVHFGGGNFFLAHFAPVAQLVGESIYVVNRSSGFRDLLANGPAVIIARRSGAATIKRVDNIAECLVASEDPAAVVNRVADPDTKLITLTVTQNGYSYSGTDVDLLLAGQAPTTPIGQIVAGLHRRYQNGHTAPVVMSLDNLIANGEIARRECVELADTLGEPAFRSWMEGVRFPSTMVDRIVPAWDDSNSAWLADHEPGLFGSPVVFTEPRPAFSLVISGHGGDPLLRSLEDVGKARLVEDVSLYSAMKRTILNGAHFVAGITGKLYGHEKLSDALADRRVTMRLINYLSCVTQNIYVINGVDTAAYVKEVMERFHNPHLPDTTFRVSRKGSEKLPDLVIRPLLNLRAQDIPVAALVETVATWAEFLGQARAHLADPSKGFAIDDPEAYKGILRLDAAVFADAGRFTNEVLSRVVPPEDVRRLKSDPDFVDGLQLAMNQHSTPTFDRQELLAAVPLPMSPTTVGATLG